MKLIIDIPNEDYNIIKEQIADGIINPLKVCIANGTPIEKEPNYSSIKTKLNDCISRAYLKDCIYEETHYTGHDILSLLETLPSVKQEPKTVYDQIRWERDIAIQQLKELGYGLGEKINQEPKTGRWIWCGGSHKCSNCGEYTCFSHKEMLRYCPNCGCRMMESEE